MLCLKLKTLHLVDTHVLQGFTDFMCPLISHFKLALKV